MEDLFSGRNIDIPEMMAHMKGVAADLGLPFGDRTMTYNSRKAAELGKWAESKGRGEPWHQSAFEAYFVHGLNIARLDVLADLARKIGLDEGEAEQVLTEGRYKQAVDDDWAYSRRVGITAVPTFVMNNRALVGAQPYEALKKLLLSRLR